MRTNRTTVTRICQQCKKQFEARTDGIKAGYGKFCSHRCKSDSMIGRTRSDHIAWVDYITCFCLNCGKVIKLKPGAVARGRGKYCSRECYYEYERAKSKTITKLCLVCGKKFDSVRNKVYCGKVCAAKHQTMRPQEDHPSWKGGMITKTCLICKKQFKVAQAVARGGGGKFCSRTCKGKYQAMQPIEAHPRWLGGLSFLPYPLEFNATLKELIHKRDKNHCAICGKRSELVHHINYEKQDCKACNLIVLCRSCHSKTNAKRDSWQAILSDIVASKSLAGFYQV